MGSLRFAEEILFLGTEGTFPEPPWLTGKTRYVGTILRDFQYTRPTRYALAESWVYRRKQLSLRYSPVAGPRSELRLPISFSRRSML